MEIKLKEYEIICELHSGARAKIYKANRIIDGYSVIIKVKNKEYQSNEDMKELQEEFQIGNRIRSSNVIKYVDIISHNNGLGIIEEYFNGETIHKLNKFNSFSLEEFLLISIQICNALRKIHGGNIVHGAINPSNILYDRKIGEVKIIDFSSAKYLGNKNYIWEDNSILKDDLNYISPEQTGRMNKTIDYRSDFYSLGITFYEMLCGRLPFKANDTMGIIYNHVAKEPECITKINSQIPKVISDIVLKLISKNPENRYKSALGLKRDLEKCLIQIRSNQNIDFELGEYDFSGEFCIPEKLYGRKEECQLLTESFNRITKGSAEIFLISGPPGIGKSVLVQDVSNMVQEKNGYFIVGRFEQFKNGSPYVAIIQAIDKFINQLLVEPSNKLSVWKDSILKAIGNNGQVIIDMFPKLELIIGNQPSISQLGDMEAQNRINLVLKKIINIIATEKHPLVMFIDDLQWADYASMNFIKTMLRDKSNEYLLVIGAYRNTDSSLLVPVVSLINDVIEIEVIPNVIKLKELERKDVVQLLKDTLIGIDQEFGSIEELSGIICDKTQGNPFYIKQFLRSLYDFGHLWFDYNLMKWCFDLEEITKMNSTENLIDSLDGEIITSKVTDRKQIIQGATITHEFKSIKLEELNLRAGIGVDLVENENMKTMESMVSNVGNICVNHWKEHIRLTLKPLSEGYSSGIEKGNIEYGGFCLAMHDKNLFHAGEHLDVLEKQIKINIRKLQKIEQRLYANYESIFGQMVQNMQDKSPNNINLIGDFCDENKMIELLKDINDTGGLSFIYLCKMMLDFYFEDYVGAIEQGKKVEKYIGGISGMVDIAIFYFFDSLARLSMHSSLTRGDQDNNLERINKNQAKMNIWSRLAPMNFLHKFYLVEAELCRVTSKIDKAKEYYDRAIDLAKQNKYLNEEALAYELAGKMYWQEDKINSAQIYLNEAYNKYQLWGAIAKTKHLVEKYPDLFLSGKENIDVTQNIDLFSIMKAAQAISSEINLQELLSRFMEVILENMGAQRGFLILKNNEDLVIEAYVDATCNKKEILTLQSLDEFEELPKTVIRFTARTGEDVVFHKNTDKFMFNKDPYIMDKKPKSFLSSPVKLKSEIKGVLYLENNLIEDVFNPDRVKVIEILSTQAAISLENAMLYNTLEQNMTEKLHNSENKLNVTVSNAGLGLWEWDIQTGNIIINNELATMIGYTLDELKHIDVAVLRKFAHPDDVENAIKIIKRCVANEIEVYECELRLKHRNGEWVWTIAKGRVIEWDTNNNPIRISGINMNISDRKTIENQLETAKKAIEEVNILKNQFLTSISNESLTFNNQISETGKLMVVTDKTKELARTNTILEEVNTILEVEIGKYNKTEAELIKAKVEAENANLAKSNFIANISHELRTPIAVILSGIQLIEFNIKNKTLENTHNLCNHIGTIKQNCYRLLRLVNNIIDVTKFDAGFGKIDFKNLNIISLIENITTSVVEYAKLKGIIIVFDTDEEERVIAVDPDKIERIFLNLISNAIKFTPKNGQIFVKISNESNKVIISVEDTGIGIQEEKQELIFEKFQQVDNTFTRKNEGSGIGLSIVKSFVQLHDGKISVFSELGKGSKFIIELPVKKIDEDKSENAKNDTEDSSGCVDRLDIEFSDIYFD